MFNRFRPIKLLPAIAAVAVVGAFSAPAASADTLPTLWLNPNGVLAFTGTSDNDWLKVTKVAKAGVPGGYVIRGEIETYDAPNYSANCKLGGGLNDWLVECPGTSVSQLTYDGGLGGDTFNNTTNLPSVAHGGPGVDFFWGGTASDTLYGDDDFDQLLGGAGDDVVDGGAGKDTIAGNSGTDIASYADAQNPVEATIGGFAGDGVVSEGVPTDFEGIQGSPYGDKLSGGAGPDTLLGGGGPDDLNGWNGDDTLKGQDGNDTLRSSGGSDVLDGGVDADSLSYGGASQSVYVYQDGQANDGMLGENDNVISIENLTGSPYNDDLEGTSGDDVITGGDGSDKIDPFFGDDTVYGGPGNDSVDGGPGAPDSCGNNACTEFDTDTVWGGNGSDTIDYSGRDDNLTIAIDGSQKSGGYMENDDLHQMENANGGSGDDTIYGNDDPNSLSGGSGGDGISGYKGNDYLSGGPGNDFLDADAGNDYVVGGEDNDLLEAAGGDDDLYGASGRDRVSYDDSGASVTAHLGTSGNGVAGEDDTIGADVEDLEGSAYADKLYGNGAGNALIGDGQGDLLVGNGGADTEQGGPGTDTLKTVGDGVKDSSACGNGVDVANADKIDAVGGDCETINKL